MSQGDPRTPAQALVKMLTPRPFEEWHEGLGPVLWWCLPVLEPPYCGDPSYDDWPWSSTSGLVFTQVVVPTQPEHDAMLRAIGDEEQTAPPPNDISPDACWFAPGTVVIRADDFLALDCVRVSASVVVRDGQDPFGLVRKASTSIESDREMCARLDGIRAQCAASTKLNGERR